MKLETREFRVRSVNTEERTIEGIAAPYNQTIDVSGYKERFEPGAFGEVTDVKLSFNHNNENIIGKVVRGEDTEDGFVIEARISDTPKGNEIYTLLKDGVLDRFSVGFIPVEDTMDEDVIVRTKVDLKEVSVVPFPAYSAAQILAVREDSANDSHESKNTNGRSHIEENMTDINYATVADLENVRDAVEEMNRRVAIMGDADATSNAPQFRNAGEFIKALAAGNDAAKQELRAYTGATTADSHVGNDWKASLLTIVDRGRPVLNLFNRGPLGPSGNTIEYPYVATLTGDVASQAAEGDDLAYLEVEIDTATTPVLTFGGYSELSRQAIERSDVSYLDSVLRYQAASYAKVTNAYVRTKMVAATPQTGTSFTLSSATAADFLGAVVDGVAKIDANGQGAQADFILVSTDVYAKMASVASTGFAFDANNSAGATIGNVNVRGMAGSLAGVPIVVDAGLAAKSLYVASANAVTSWENAGAPVRLEDENIINLTKQFSLYGYLAAAVTNANGLVKATVA